MKIFNLLQKSRLEQLKSYSFRNGWNGPLMHVSKKKDFFEEVKRPEGIYEDELGLVVKVSDDHIKILDKK